MTDRIEQARQMIVRQAPLPPFEQIQAAGRRRRKNRRGVVALAAVAALTVLVAGGAAAVRTVVPSPYDPVTAKEVPIPEKFVVCDTVPVDAQRTFQLVSEKNCMPNEWTPILLRTDDAGRRWSAFLLPAKLGCPGEDSLNFLAVGVHPSLITPDLLTICAMATRDDGATWTRLQPGPAVRQVPVDWVLLPQPPITMSPPTGVVAVDPGDGTVHHIAGAPASDAGGLQKVAVASDGSYWISGGLVTYASQDRGRSWREVRVPDVGNAAEIHVRTADGRHVYGTTWSVEAGLALYESENGGRTWQLVSKRVKDRVTAVHVRPDGALLGFVDGGDDWGRTSPVLVSRDGGRSFVPLGNVRGALYRDLTGKFLLETDASMRTGVKYSALSSDGVTFDPVPVPPGATRPR